MSAVFVPWVDPHSVQIESYIAAVQDPHWRTSQRYRWWCTVCDAESGGFRSLIACEADGDGHATTGGAA